MKKKLISVVLVLVCAITCVFGLTACGKELNYLKADDGSGQLKTEFNFGTVSADELSAKLSGLTFYYEYYPDRSTEKADMAKIKVKHFVNGNEEHEGLPEQFQMLTSYTVCYYYEGHEPTADASDSFVVTIIFSVT